MTTLSNIDSSVADRREALGLVSDFAPFVRALKALFDPYRPERHYMRGAGPKWHAKHVPVRACAEDVVGSNALPR